MKVLNPKARGYSELADAFADAERLSRARPGDRLEVVTVFQGGKIVAVRRAPWEQKVLDRRVG